MAMLQSGRDCVEILTQLVAVSHAVNGAGFVLIKDGLRHCADTPETAARLDKQLEKVFLSLA
jgi:DNA-binding FrmR family transcriptional regulator